MQEIRLREITIRIEVPVVRPRELAGAGMQIEVFAVERLGEFVSFIVEEGFVELGLGHLHVLREVFGYGGEGGFVGDEDGDAVEGDGGAVLEDWEGEEAGDAVVCWVGSSAAGGCVDGFGTDA